jgi:hypothetical protein
MPKLKVGTFPTTVIVSATSNSLTSGSDGESIFVFPEESGDFDCGICGSGTQSANFSGPTSGGEGGSMFVRTVFRTVDEVVEATVVDGALVTLGASVLAGASVAAVLVVVVTDDVVVDVVVVDIGNELESPYWNKRTPAAQRCSNLPIGY